MKKIFLLSVISLVFNMALYAQKITGNVKDANGPLPSATIVEKGLVTNGTAADKDGNFSITLKGSSRTLIVKRIGYSEQDVRIPAGENNVNVIMQANDQSLDQVVVVGYGTKKRITNTGSVSSISGSVIRNIPTANVQNTLQGKLPGFFSVQRGGQPGKDASDFFIRGVSSLNADGNKPLIIVDDIEYTYEQLAQINVNEIESISILKDASTTAIYGIKGANGVLIVRTRRGASSVPQVNVRVEMGRQSPTKQPRFLNSFETASLVNEALVNDGLQPRFTQEDLTLFQNNQDPYGHPNVNWYDVIFKPYSSQANTNIDISGGSEAVRYFISAGTFSQNGNLNDFTDPRNQGVDNQYYFKRYNFRSNLDIQATRSLKFRLDVTGRFGQINQPLFYPYPFGTGTSGIMQEIYDFHRITPYAAPVLNPDGSYAYAFGPELTNEPTLNARLATLGYNRTTRTDYNVLFGVTEKLDFITNGLSFEARIAYASTADIIRVLSRGEVPPSFHYNPLDSSYTLDKHGNYTLSTYGLYSGNGIFNKRVNLQAFLNYDKTFGDHHVNSLLLFNRNNYSFRESVPEKFQGFTGKVGYEYQKKYLVDFNAGFNGSDRFQAGNRYGFFPAIGVGWNIAEEDFFKNRYDFVQLFKLRASYGLVGSDAVPDNRYLYNQVYNRGGFYYFGETPNGVWGISEGSLGNTNVTWEKARKFDVGIDANLFKDKITLTVDYFNDYRFDQLFFPGSVPSILGVGFARENLAIVRNKGFDGSLKYQDKIGNVQFDITGVFSYAKNKILFQDEPNPAYPWLARTGHPIGQPFGYTWVGFYQDEEDIAKSPKPLVDPAIIKPGDLKYADLNGDGIIDEGDQGPIGKPNLPNTSAGITLGVHYKGLDISVLFQGAFNYSFSVLGIGIEPFQSQLQPVHQERWTPQNSNNAAFPRLSSMTTTSSPTAYPSSFWLIDARYVRLKTVEVGYQLPPKALPLKINNARFYFSGYNLLTWTNYSLYQQDPEVASNTAGDSYLNQRVMNIGLQVGF